jgi:hypothetical protein
MTILLSVSHADDLDTLARAVYQALILADCPDLASEAAAVRSQARDGAEYLAAVLRLSDELKVEWKGVPA